MAWITIINGEVRNVRQPTEEAAREWLDAWTYSGPDAVKIAEAVPDDRWSEREASQVRRLAWRMFNEHDHPGYVAHSAAERKLVQENCGACVLGGWYPKGTRAATKRLGPNYAGWARLMVEAGRPIPARWRVAFLAELLDRTDNEPYRNALQLSVATFGVRFETEHHSIYPAGPFELVLLPSERSQLALDRVDADV